MFFGLGINKKKKKKKSRKKAHIPDTPIHRNFVSFTTYNTSYQLPAQNIFIHFYTLPMVTIATIA
jgi:hypothetical protein